MNFWFLFKKNRILTTWRKPVVWKEAHFSLLNQLASLNPGTPLNASALLAQLTQGFNFIIFRQSTDHYQIALANTWNNGHL